MRATATNDTHAAALAAASAVLRGTTCVPTEPCVEPSAERQPPRRLAPWQRGVRLLRRPPRGTTFAIWCGAIWLLYALNGLAPSGVRVTGYVEARSYEVASLAGGRVETLLIGLQQDVEAGEVLATLQGDEAELALQAATAELARLRAERDRAAAGLSSAATEQAAAHRADLRRFAAERDRARLDVLQLAAEIAENTGRLARFDVELSRLDELGAELVAPEKLQDKHMERDMLATRLQHLRALHTEHVAVAARAEQREDEFADGVRPPAPRAVELAPFEQAIATQQARLDQLRLAQRNLVLRAPVAGRVAAIGRREGEVVAAGQSVLTVIEREPSAVVAHVPEELVQRLSLGSGATISRCGNPGEKFDAVVIHTGAEVERMPRRAEAGSPLPQWGFPVHLSCPPGRGVVAGEAFTVQFRTVASATPSMP